MQRWIAAILAVVNVANGLAMLFAGSIWWTSIPGVPETGPFNPHFVQRGLSGRGRCAGGPRLAGGLLAGRRGRRRIPCRARS